MFKTLVSALTLSAVLAIPAAGAFAADSVNLTAELKDKVRTTLTEQGYEVRKIKSEDGLIEAYVIKDGTREEIYMNADLEIVNRKSND